MFENPPFLILVLLGALVATTGTFLYLMHWRHLSLFHKQRRIQDCAVRNPDMPRISIIIPSHDQAHLLRETIPLLFQQNYPDFEVIVVDEASTDETMALLNSYSKHYPRLRSTFIPKTASHHEQRKLSITLGARAARSSWCLLATPDIRPLSNEWLRAFSAHFDESTHLLSGQCLYPACKSMSKRNLFHILQRICSASAGLSDAEICNLCFRRQTFLDTGGFSAYSGIPFSEGKLLACTLSHPGNTKVLVTQDSFVLNAYAPQTSRGNYWKHFRREWRCFGKNHHRFLYRKWTIGLLWSLHYAGILAYIGLRTFKIIRTSDWQPSEITIDSFFFLVILATLVIPMIHLRKSRLAYTSCLSAT